MPPTRDSRTLTTPVLVLSLLLVLMSLPAVPNHFLNLILPTAHAATFTVDATGDGADSNLADGVCNDGTGACTLRAAIQQANANAGADQIIFAPALTSGGPSTINLSTALADLTSDMTIDGPGGDLLTVQRSSAVGIQSFRIFRVDSGASVSIQGLTIANGLTEDGTGPAFIGAPGGGILNLGTLTLTNDTIRGNQTGNGLIGGGSGAGVFNQGTLTVSNSTISANHTGLGGIGGSGAGILNAGTMTLVNTTVSGNQTSNGNTNKGGFGGGIYNVIPHTLTLINTTVSGNTTGNGVNGFPGGDGGGIYNDDGGIINIKNSIVANNTVGTGGSGPDLSGTFNSQDYNLIENTNGSNLNGTITHNITGQDPKLGGLASNGGPTQTHALLAGSRALDAGDNCVFENTCLPAYGFPLETDERSTSFSRKVDGPDADTTDTVDIGSFEG